MKILKRIRKILGSMPLAIILLIVLAAACAVCSAIPQKEAPEWYRQEYGERTGSLIIGLHADDAYHSVWFLVLSDFLCLSLIMCNLTRIRSLIRRTKGKEESIGKIWGAWVCHLGMLLLVIGFSLSQMTQEGYDYSGAPGMPGSLDEAGLQVTVDSFSIDRRDDGSIDQYRCSLTVTDEAGNTESGETSINHPVTLCGYDFYQSSYGWKADVAVRRNDRILQQTELYVGENLKLADNPDIAVVFYGFYPHYDEKDSAASSTGAVCPDQPGYLYMVFFQDEMRYMNVLKAGEEITINDEYTITFDHPTFVHLMVKRDRFEWIVLAGAAVVLAGLVMAFYLRKR